MSFKEDLNSRITKFEENDSSLTTFIVGTNEPINSNYLTRVAEAVGRNSYVKELNLKKTGFNTDHALLLAKSLEQNQSLEKINLEDNSINPPGIIAIANALKNNQSVLELRLVNQKSAFGNEAETCIADMMEENTFLEKIVVVIKNGGARTRVNKFETRNKDYNRRRKRGENIDHLLPKKPEPKVPIGSPVAPTIGSTAMFVKENLAFEKEKEEQEARRKKKEEEEALKKKEEETLKKKQEEEALKKKQHEEETLKKKKQEEEALMKKQQEEEALKKKQQESKPQETKPQQSSFDNEKTLQVLNHVLSRLNEIEITFERLNKKAESEGTLSSSLQNILGRLDTIATSFTRIESRLNNL